MDWIEVIKTGFSTVISLGLTYWVYKVLSKIIEELKYKYEENIKEMEKLKLEVASLKASEGKWQRKFGKVVRIVRSKKCKVDCPLQIELENLIDEEEK